MTELTATRAYIAIGSDRVSVWDQFMRRAAESFRNPPKDEELEALLTVSATLPFVQMRTRFGFILEERGATEV